MSRLLGSVLPAHLFEYLRGDPTEQEGRAILLTTVDPLGFPHAALLSSWEVFAIDKRNVRVATYSGSSTTSNLKKSGKATLVAFDSGSAYYIKGSAELLREPMKEDTQNSLFNLKLEAVLEDAAPGLGVTGINYEGANEENHRPLHRELVEGGRYAPP